MIYMKNFIIVLLLSLWSNIIFTQTITPEIISSSGETSQVTAIQIDWTLGEVATITIQNLSQQITQGFHQPSYVITSVSTLLQEIGHVSVYPNPTSDLLNIHLNLNLNNRSMNRLQYCCFVSFLL